MLLIMEALEEGTITKETMVPRATAVGYGRLAGLHEGGGESFSVHDMLKAIAVALRQRRLCGHGGIPGRQREHLCGKDERQSGELGIENTVFVNCTGLPAEDITPLPMTSPPHVPGADPKPPRISAPTTIWMDTLRDGQFQLSNTNKLIRFYEGATGLKNRLHRRRPLYCVSRHRGRDGAHRRGAGLPPSADRFETAKALLNYGFRGIFPWSQ